jgi:hypothetical protein
LPVRRRPWYIFQGHRIPRRFTPSPLNPGKTSGFDFGSRLS